MTDKSKLVLGVVLGAIAGIAIMKLFESEKGKEFVENTKHKAQSTADEIKEKIHQLQNELAELLNTPTENASKNA